METEPLTARSWDATGACRLRAMRSRKKPAPLMPQPSGRPALVACGVLLRPRYQEPSARDEDRLGTSRGIQPATPGVGVNVGGVASCRRLTRGPCKHCLPCCRLPWRRHVR